MRVERWLKKHDTPHTRYGRRTMAYHFAEPRVLPQKGPHLLPQSPPHLLPGLLPELLPQSPPHWPPLLPNL